MCSRVSVYPEATDELLSSVIRFIALLLLVSPLNDDEAFFFINSFSGFKVI